MTELFWLDAYDNLITDWSPVDHVLVVEKVKP
jgi:hypothetical protein